MQIITNNHWNDFVYGYELTDTEKADFDYIDEIDSDAYFIRYKGVVYHLEEFMRIEYSPDELKDWDGIHNDTFFSGVLIRISDDVEQYQIATCYS